VADQVDNSTVSDLSRKLGTSGGSNVDMDAHTLSTYRKKISVHNVLKQVVIVRLNHVLFLEEKYRTGKERLTIRQGMILKISLRQLDTD
jgi:hypothetical protein